MPSLKEIRKSLLGERDTEEVESRQFNGKLLISNSLLARALYVMKSKKNGNTVRKILCITKRR